MLNLPSTPNSANVCQVSFVPMLPFDVTDVLHLVSAANSAIFGFIIGSPRCPLKYTYSLSGNLSNASLNFSSDRWTSGYTPSTLYPYRLLGQSGHLALQYVLASTCNRFIAVFNGHKKRAIVAYRPFNQIINYAE